jgi:sarcosine oxidase subunit beta
MQTSTSTAIIIGGGVIGLSTAYHLALKHFGRIIVLEKDHIGSGSSLRAGGIVTGLLWTDTGVAVRKLALRRFHELSDELPGYRFHDVGTLNLFDPPSWPERELLFPLYDRHGAPYEVFDAAEIRSRWPELTPPEDTIALFDPLGGYSEPEEYVPALAQRCRELGVDIREQQQVTGFLEKDGRICGVHTPTGIVHGDAVVCTVHAWVQPLMDRLQAQKPVQVPVKAFVHQRYVTTAQPVPFRLPAINANPQGGYLRPNSGNRLLVGGETAQRTEFRVESLTFHMDGLAAPDWLRGRLRENIAPLLPRLAETAWETEKVGLICFSMDAEPLLGPLAQFPGLYLGCAFHSGGFGYNPAAGLLLAEFVADGRTQIDVGAFSPDRFISTEVSEYLASTVTQEHAVRRRH